MCVPVDMVCTQAVHCTACFPAAACRYASNDIPVQATPNSLCMSMQASEVSTAQLKLTYGTKALAWEGYLIQA